MRSAHRHPRPQTSVRGLVLGVLAPALAFLVLAACDQSHMTEPGLETEALQAGPVPVSQAAVVEVIARHEGEHYVFDLSDEVVPAGWTTFELDNHSASTHFVYLAQVPEPLTTMFQGDRDGMLDYWYENLTRPFQWFMDGMIPGKDQNTDDLSEVYETLFPHWFEDAIPSGGPGFTGGFLSSRTTVNLNPGYYIIECYVKDANGDFHSYNGMLTLLKVTGDAPSRTGEPRSSMEIRLATGELEVPESVRPGLHTVAVHFDEQPVGGYDHLLGHDVHLVRLDGGWDAESTAEWMNWMDPAGLVSASGVRGPATFMGGAQTMMAGQTAYITVRLEPGEYAWVSEVPAGEGMWETFTVPHGNSTGTGGNH